MKKKYVRIMFLSMALLTTSVTATYAALPKDDKKEKEEISSKLDEIETVCTSEMEPTEKWNKLRPYVMWLSGKSLAVASRILPLLNMIG